MKQTAATFRVLNTVTDYTRLCGLPAPAHPLLTLIDLAQTHDLPPPVINTPVVQQLYSVWLKKDFIGRLHYGHQSYDFREGVLSFVAPGQVFSVDDTLDVSALSGWMLVFHPDLLRKYPLAQKIAQYGFFSYAVHEALHLSAGEEAILTGIMQHIGQEYHANINQFSQRVRLSQLELLLTYAERLYHRQFITCKVTNRKLINELQELLTDYFTSDALAQQGPPSVSYIADALNVSPNYLSVLLRMLTTRQHVQDKLIEKAKADLSTTRLMVSEIAYAFGFEHPQSFSKLFKSKTQQSPPAIRQSFKYSPRYD